MLIRRPIHIFARKNMGLRFNETSPYDYRMSIKSGDTIYFLDKDDQIIREKVKEIKGKIHSFGLGYALSIVTEFGTEMSSFWCYPSKKDLQEILTKRTLEIDTEVKDSSEIQTPQIKNNGSTTLAEQIVSVQPMMNPSDTNIFHLIQAPILTTKAAICPKCKKYHLIASIETFNSSKSTKKEFVKLLNEGFLIIETTTEDAKSNFGYCEK